MPRFRLPALLTALVCAFPAPAQAPRAAVAFAEAWLAATAPAVDDPDAVAADLIAATAEFRSAPYAFLLADGVSGALAELQRPGALLPAVRALLERDDLHGLLRQDLAWLQFRLLRASAPATEALRCDPAAHWPGSFLCVGPFGGDEDHFTGVSFAPELLPWNTDTEFREAGRRLRPRLVSRRLARPSIDPTDPAHDRDGCFYALHRMAAAGPTQCYLHLACDGALEVFVNGERLAALDPRLGDGNPTHFVPVGLAAGVNHVLIKTCTRSRGSFALVYRDAHGNPQPGLRELPAAEPVAPAPAPLAATSPPFLDAVSALRAALAAAGDGERSALQIVLGHVTERSELLEDPLALVTDLQPTDPTQQLALARLWRRIGQVPEEIRNARARTLEEAAAAQLGDDHWAMLRSTVRLLAETDRREQALQRLWAAVDAGRAGPAIFRLLLQTARDAQFTQELQPILERWRRALPNDPEPLIELAQDHYRAGATARAAELATTAVRRRPDLGSNLRFAWSPLLDLGQLDTAAELRQLVMPDVLAAEEDRLTEHLWDLTAAQRETTDDHWLALARQIVAHPEANGERLRATGDQLTRAHHDALAIRAYERALALDPDDWETRRCLLRLRGDPDPGADFVRFRHDGAAAIAAFAKSDRDDAAAATVLIDQRIVEVFADGSRLIEVHELRRLNDPSAVEQYSSASAPAGADEVLLLRTITAGGEQFVPVKVQDDYSMPRLEPGAFVEWRYREHRRAPDDGVFEVDEFLFRSTSEHLMLAELVVIQPAGAPLELRSRNLPEPATMTDLGDGRVAHRFTVRDSLRLLPEDSAPPLAALVPVVAGGADRSAAGKLRSHRYRLASAIRPTPPIRDEIDRRLAGIEDPAAQLQALHEFCQREIATASSGSPTETLLLKKGNRQLLLLAMLRAADFVVEPALCESIREDLITGDGALFRNPERYFDAAAMRVRKASLQPTWLFFDTPRHWPAGRIPPQRAGGGALLATAAGQELVAMPPDADRMQHIAITAQGTLSASRLEIEAELRMCGMEGFLAAEYFLQQPTNLQEQFARQFAQGVFRGWQVRAATVVGLEPGAPITVRATLRRRALQDDGERLLLAMPLPSDEVLARFGARPDRTLPIRHTEDYRMSWDLRLELDGVRLAAVPATTALQFPPLAFLQEVRVVDGDLVVRRRTTMGSGTTPVARLGDWLAVLQQVERAQNLNLEFVAR